MPPGEAFTDAQRAEISRAVADAEAATGWTFAVEIGPASGDSRGYAEALHARLPAPANSIVIEVDPERRTLEIVTGASVRRVLDNRAAGLVAVGMQSTFAGGDLSRGLADGVRQLATLGQRPRSLHTDTP